MRTSNTINKAPSEEEEVEMVEFGLKLSDNKVADWSDSYIRYEKLKQILKKCETDQNRYNDLASRDRVAAEAIRDAFGQGLSTPKSSSASLHQLLSTGVSPPRLSTTIGSQQVVSPLGATQDEEQTTVLPPPPPPTTTTDKLEATSTSDDGSGRAAFATESSRLSDTEFLLKESSSTPGKTMSGGSNYGSVHSVLERATSSVSGYFGRSSFEQQVRDALKAIEKDTLEFGNNLAEDLTTVNAFYEEKLYEIQGRLTFLKDTVAQSRAEFAIMAAEASAEARSSTSQTQAAGGQTSSDDSSKLESGRNAEEFPDDKETPLIERRKSSHSPKQLWRRASAAVQSATMVATNHHRSHSMTPLLGDSSLSNEGGEYELPMKNKLSPEDRARLLREAESTQRALVDLYRTAKLLHNFAILNFTGFVKIVKKFNKTLPQHKGRFKQAIKPENVCDEGKAVEALADRMVVLYANWFCQGSKSEAQVQIMPKKGDTLEMDWTQLRVGYRMGMCTILALWVAWDCIWGLYSKGRSTIGERDAFPVFRACAGLLLLQWFWGVSVWVWTRFRINYIYLFDFNPHIVDSPMAIFNAAVDHTLVYLISMLLYYKAGTHDIPGKFPEGVYPFFLVVYACLQLVIPVRTRLPMWGQIWRVVTAPAHSPSFFQGYIGDIFTSMVKVFQDMAWTAFFIFSGDWMVSEDSSDANVHHWSKTTWYRNILIPLLTLLPLWFRFNQCLRRYLDTSKRFPHLANAFKYALAQTVTLFGAFHPLYLDHTNQRADMSFYQRWWMLQFIGSSLYSFTWDVYMDWGLGLPKFNMLGPRLMFPNRAIYYAIISADLVLRFAWVLTLIPPNTGAKFALPNYLAAVSMILELGRRTVWGFLRLENEHRSNTAGYRRVNFVPLHFTTGHKHDYSHGKEHRGIRVLLEVAFVTLAVLAACVVSVVAAQHATDLSKNEL